MNKICLMSFGANMTVDFITNETPVHLLGPGLGSRLLFYLRNSFQQVAGIELRTSQSRVNLSTNTKASRTQQYTESNRSFPLRMQKYRGTRLRLT